MSAQEGVLAVLDSAVHILDRGPYGGEYELQQARETVAGLIDAARRVITCFTALGESRSVESELVWRSQCERAMTALDSATARAMGQEPQS